MWITSLSIIMLSIACILNSISIRNLAKADKAQAQAIDVVLDIIHDMLDKEIRRLRADD